MGNPYAPPSGNAPRPPAPSPHPPGPLPHPVPTPPGPQRPGPQRPGEPDPAGRPVKAPDPAAVQATGKQIGLFGLLLLAAVLTYALPLPVQVASIGFMIAALVVGTRALRQAWRAGLRGALVTTLAAGLAFTLLLTMSMGSLFVLWPVLIERQQCLQRALTVAATGTCQVEYERGLDDRLKQLTISTTRS